MMTPNPSESNSEPYIEYTFDDETPPSIAILQAIAILENTSPIELPDECELTLYDHIDPEALDRLVETETEGNVTITLELHSDHEYAIQIHDTGQLVVQKAG